MAWSRAAIGRSNESIAKNNRPPTCSEKTRIFVLLPVGIFSADPKIYLCMKVDVVLGLQWGDEGKGKVVDVLTPDYGVIARFQGGPNAGHSLHFGDKVHVLRSIPSGIFRENAVNIIGNGVVLDPVTFAQETGELEQLGVDVKAKIRIAKKAHLILPTHRMLDAASEAAKGKAKIGSTLKGIGPTYMDKTGRNGLRVGDILSPSFMERYERLKQKHIAMLAQFEGFTYDIAEYEAQWFAGIETLRQFTIIEAEHEMHRLLNNGQAVLAEGAQGSLLDVDYGTYPFVTSSNTVCAGACIGLGVAPNRIGEVFGIFKAYCTRVGSGPFPTELFDQTGKDLQQIGHEFGAVTGRERRCGWLDLVALKYSAMINGVTQLIMMKSDVLNTFPTIKVAVAYEIGGQRVTEFPYETNEEITPIYKEFEGWSCDINGIRRYEEFPRQFKEYVEFIERETGVPVKIISVGPDRDETIVR